MRSDSAPIGAGARRRVRSAVLIDPSDPAQLDRRQRSALDAELDIRSRLTAVPPVDQLTAVLRRHRPDLLLSAVARSALGPDLLLACAAEGVEVCLLAGPTDGLDHPLRLRRLGGLPWLRIEPDRRIRQRLQRVTDLALVLLTLPVTVPLIATLALLVAASGPPLLFQERVGRGGQVFRMVKIRSMRLNAESTTGPVRCGRDDDRVTWLGRHLRRSRLDELPQLWNVLRGQMSLVGPRPERPEFVREYRLLPGYDQRHLIRPGLTGLAQLTGGYDATPEEKLRCDLIYLNSRSLRVDLGLLGLTLFEWLRGFPHG